VGKAFQPKMGNLDRVGLSLFVEVCPAETVFHTGIGTISL
jgi:hypothetical protein